MRVSAPVRGPAADRWMLDGLEFDGLDYETHHRVAVARELTYEAGCPLRDR